MNIHCVAPSSTFFFHQVMGASSKKSYLIVAIALAAISSLALMALCYRRMKNKSIKLEKDDKQLSKPIDGITLNAPKGNQPVAKSQPLSPQKFVEKKQSPTPSRLSQAFSSPQGLWTSQASEYDSSEDEEYSSDENDLTYNRAVVDSPAQKQQESKEVLQLNKLISEWSHFMDNQDPKTPIKNKLGLMESGLNDMIQMETNTKASIDNTEYSITELSAWRADHTYIIKHDLMDSIANSFLEPGTEMPAPQLLDLIPREILVAYDHENSLVQLEAMVNAAIDHYKKIQEQDTKSLSELKLKIGQAKDELYNAKNEARAEYFAWMRSISNQYGTLLKGLSINANAWGTSVRWDPSSNTFFLDAGMVWVEIDSPENLRDDIDYWDDQGNPTVFYKVNLNILNLLMQDFLYQVERLKMTFY